MKVHTPIYVINLKRNPERKIFIQRQLDTLNLNYQFVEAVDKYDLQSQEYRTHIAQSLGIDKFNLEYKCSETVHTSKGYKGYKNAILGRAACLLSHIKTFNLILKNNADTACVLEDDALLLPTFPVSLTAATGLSWDLLMLSSHSRTIRGTLEKHNDIYKRIMKSHNCVVLIRRGTKTPPAHKYIIELLGFPTHLYPNQSEAIMKILSEFNSMYESIIELYNPRRHLVWLLFYSAAPEAFVSYRRLREYTTCQLGGLPVKHSQQRLDNYHCIAEPAEQHASAMGYLLNRSAVKAWKRAAIGKNILGIDDIPWHLHRNNKVRLRFVSPPCVRASYTYLKYSSHFR